MSQKVSDFLLQRLAAWGIKRIYGYPGDAISGILGALERSRNQLEFVQVCHEEMAAFMATAHAKFTNEVGVCLATAGPGAIHLLNGLYDAKMDHQPVVAIVGQCVRAAIGGNQHQELDLLSLFKDVASEYVYMASSAQQIRQLVDRAIRIAQSARTVTCIIIPKDVQDLDVLEEYPRAREVSRTGIGYTALHTVPTTEDLQRAADVLNDGNKVAMLIGAGTAHAAKEVMEVAELLGAGVAKALLGKTVLSDYLPYVTGCVGRLGSRPSWELMMECDTLLMIGSSFPYSEFLPQEGQARGVQIDIDGRMLSLRYPMEVNLLGDSAHTLRALIPRLWRKANDDWRQSIELNTKRWWQFVEAHAMEDAHPINPERVFLELSKRLPESAFLSVDVGTAASWYARTLRVKAGIIGSLSGGLETMGAAVPYGIAAKFAHPNLISIVCTGDGAMLMGGINELMTVVKYWKHWSDPRLIFLVLNNRDLNQVTWKRRIEQGGPEREVMHRLPEFPYARYADLIGLRGICVEKTEDIGNAWNVALTADRPAVLEVYTDPNVQPIDRYLDQTS